LQLRSLWEVNVSPGVGVGVGVGVDGAVDVDVDIGGGGGGVGVGGDCCRSLGVGGVGGVSYCCCCCYHHVVRACPVTAARTTQREVARCDLEADVEAG
jgi:hypothetical protein